MYLMDYIGGVHLNSRPGLRAAAGQSPCPRARAVAQAECGAM